MSGSEIRIRFTKRVFILPVRGGSVGDEHLVELQGASRPLDTTDTKTHHDFVNPTYTSATAKSHEKWQSPEEGGDTPGALEGVSTQCWIADKPPTITRDDDSPFQEPDWAVSYGP